MATIRVEVIAPVISLVEPCRHCRDFFRDAGLSERVNRDVVDSYPEEMRQEYARLCQVLRDVVARHGPGLTLKLIDPQTPLGLWKGVRHRVRSYPTFIVNRRATYTGWSADAISDLVRHGAAGAAADSAAPERPSRERPRR